MTMEDMLPAKQKTLKKLPQAPAQAQSCNSQIHVNGVVQKTILPLGSHYYRSHD